MALVRPELAVLDGAPPASLPRDEIARIYPDGEGGYSVLFGFGSSTLEFQISAEGETVKAAGGPSDAIRRLEPEELPEPARRAVEQALGEYRAEKLAYSAASLSP